MGSKGSPGEASIFRAKDGRWHGWITVGVRTNGKPDRRHRTAKTRNEVVRKIRELEVRRETGTITAVNSDTVEAWFRHWLTNIAARRVRPRTLESYESMIRMHITPYLGGQRLDRLQPEHLEELYNALIEKRPLPHIGSPGASHHLPRAEGRHAAPAHPPQRRHPRRPARPAPQRGRDRAHPRGGHRGSARGTRPARRSAVDRRPRPRPTAVGSASTAMERHRPAQRHARRTPHTAPRQRQGPGVRAAENPAQSRARLRCPSRWSGRCTSTRPARPASA